MSGKENRKYKDSVFTLLFGEKSRLRELYNAISGKNIASDDDIEINTLKSPIFSGKVNDISFRIGNKFIIMLEHQSTLNKNIAYRFLQYVVLIYETMIPNDLIYRSKMQKLPRPEFWMLYNGEAEIKNNFTIKLSECFEGEGYINLDLKVRVMNINKGHNKSAMKKSATLNEYAAFIAKVRENQENGMTFDKAIKEAVKYCVNHNILHKFLKEQGGEIVNLLKYEFKLKDAKRVWEEEAHEEGLEKGLEKAREEIAVNLLKKNKFSIDEISEISNLSVEKINKLKEKK